MLLDAGLSVPMPDAHAGVQQVGQRRDAAAELGVALGAVRHGDAAAAQDADVVAREVDAVHGQEVAVQHVPLLQVLDGRDAVGLDQHALPAHLLAVVVGELARAGADVGELVLALRDVAHDLEAALLRQPRDALVQQAGDGVRRVRGEAHVEPLGRGGLRLGEPPLHVGHGLFEPRVVDAEHLEVEAAAQAYGPGRLQRHRAVAGVGDGGDAGGDGLHGAEPRADEVLLRGERRLDVDEADDPVGELGVVEDAAERRVLDVAVAVDEAGHDDRPPGVDDRSARVLADEPRGGTDGEDPARRPRRRRRPAGRER